MKTLSKYVESVCKIGQGADCCRYLVIGNRVGFECMKVHQRNKDIIDLNWTTHFHISQGDNCEGKENLFNAD